MAKVELFPGLTLVNRKGWKAKKSHPRLGKKVARSRRTHVIIHHTVLADEQDATPNIWERQSSIFANMRKLQTIRTHDLGADVPYNFVAYFVKKNDGIVICEGRGEDRTGAHTKGHNTKGIAIALAGDFENRTVAGIEFAKRMHLLSAFIGWLRYSASAKNYGKYKPMRNLDNMVPQGRKVFFHRDFKKTACPGELIIPHLHQIDFLDPEDLT